MSLESLSSAIKSCFWDWNGCGCAAGRGKGIWFSIFKIYRLNGWKFWNSQIMLFLSIRIRWWTRVKNLWLVLHFADTILIYVSDRVGVKVNFWNPKKKAHKYLPGKVPFGADMVFEARGLVVFRNCILVRSLVLMKLKGCLFLRAAVAADMVGGDVVFSVSVGNGGGGGPATTISCDLARGTSLVTTLTWCFSSKVEMFASDLVLCNLKFLLPAILRKYSDGLISEFESLSAFGNFGGINGSTNCLFTKWGPPDGVSWAGDGCDTDDTASTVDEQLVVTTTVDLSLAGNESKNFFVYAHFHNYVG